MAQVGNKKKMYVGDTAKSATVCLLYRADAPDDNTFGLNSSTGLPWIDNFAAENRIDEELTTPEDVQEVLEKHLFIRKEVDIPQGRANGLAIAYGIESVNKVFFASKPPIEIALPPPNKPSVVFTSCFFNLEIAGENFPSKAQKGTVLMLINWNEWTYPSKVTLTSTPSRWKNLLLLAGIGRNQKVIKTKKQRK